MKQYRVYVTCKTTMVTYVDAKSKKAALTAAIEKSDWEELGSDDFENKYRVEQVIEQTAE